VGIDFDSRRCQEAKNRAENELVASLVEIRHGDVMEADFSNATIVTLYLLPESNRRLKPKLAALTPGSRVVSHDFGIEGWTPLKEKVLEVDGIPHRIYVWEIGRQEGK
jgi:hypothetical protein